MPKGNSQQKSTPDTRIRHQQVGAELRESAALLRVRTGPACPEGNLRELRGNLRELEREREREN